MKRLLCSSFVLLALTSVSCSGNGKASKSNEVKSESNAVKSEMQYAPPVSSSDSNVNQEPTRNAQPNAIHPHGVPDQQGLDSVKNSYPKKK